MSVKTVSQSPTPTTTLVAVVDFPAAMDAIIAGKKVRKQEWADAGEPESYATLSNGWLSIFRNGQMHPWQVNDGDMRGKDWIIIE